MLTCTCSLGGRLAGQRPFVGWAGTYVQAHKPWPSLNFLNAQRTVALALRGTQGPRPALEGARVAKTRFRTIQACPKDLSLLIWQVERAGDPASKREGHAMDERTIDQTQGWISDTQAMGLYSTLLFVVIALWVYVPA
jgi:hypothetical protein